MTVGKMIWGQNDTGHRQKALIIKPFLGGKMMGGQNNTEE